MQAIISFLSIIPATRHSTTIDIYSVAKVMYLFPTCFKCHEIADIIIDSQVVTRKVWIHVANDYEERDVKEKVTEEYFMCGMCGRILKT